MLVLSRFEGQRIVIGANAEYYLTVEKIDVGQAVLRLSTSPDGTGISTRRTLRFGDTFPLALGVMVRHLGLFSQQVRLGFDGPRNVPIDREELYLAKLRNPRPQAAS